MPKRMPPANWPDAFTEFPLNDDDQLANAWFTEKENMDFSSWGKGKGVTGEKAGDWKDLEYCIKTITGQSRTTISMCGKAAAQHVLAREGSGKHATDDQRRRIGTRASSAIKKQMTCGWKDTSDQWVQEACTALAPRFIHLWKKSEREYKLKLDPDKEDGKRNGKQESDSDKEPESPQKRIKPNNWQPRPSNENPLTSTPPRNKSVIKGRGASAQVLYTQGSELSLSQRKIQVSIVPAAHSDKDIEHGEGDNEIMFGINIAACVHHKFHLRENADIRSDYLSLEKFWKQYWAVSGLDDKDIDQKKHTEILTYKTEKGFGVEHVEVRSEGDFQMAVAILAIHANQNNDPLEMQIRETNSRWYVEKVKCCATDWRRLL